MGTPRAGRRPRRAAERFRDRCVRDAGGDADGRALKLYVDSSAIVKLVQTEAESQALRRYLRRHRDDEKLTSVLARIEVLRAVHSGGAAAVTKARRQLARVHLVVIDRDLLDEAATMAPGTVLRTLDAIHLASARVAAADLRAVVTYDRRMASAATTMGFKVEAPS